MRLIPGANVTVAYNQLPAVSKPVAKLAIAQKQIRHPVSAGGGAGYARTGGIPPQTLFIRAKLRGLRNRRRLFHLASALSAVRTGKALSAPLRRYKYGTGHVSGL